MVIFLKKTNKKTLKKTTTFIDTCATSEELVLVRATVCLKHKSGSTKCGYMTTIWNYNQVKSVSPDWASGVQIDWLSPIVL